MVRYRSRARPVAVAGTECSLWLEWRGRRSGLIIGREAQLAPYDVIKAYFPSVTSRPSCCLEPLSSQSRPLTEAPCLAGKGGEKHHRSYGLKCSASVHTCTHIPAQTRDRYPSRPDIGEECPGMTGSSCTQTAGGTTHVSPGLSPSLRGHRDQEHGPRARSIDREGKIWTWSDSVRRYKRMPVPTSRVRFFPPSRSSFSIFIISLFRNTSNRTLPTHLFLIPQSTLLYPFRVCIPVFIHTLDSPKVVETLHSATPLNRRHNSRVR